VRVNVSHVWLCIKEVSGSYSKNVARTSRLLQARRQGVSRPSPGEGTSIRARDAGQQDFRPPARVAVDLTVSLRRRTAPLLDGSRDEFMLTGVHKNSDAAANWVLTMDRFGTPPSCRRRVAPVEVDTGFVELNAFLNRPLATSCWRSAIRGDLSRRWSSTKPGEGGTRVFEGARRSMTSCRRPPRSPDMS
jgi:hypothetical protein